MVIRGGYQNSAADTHTTAVAIKTLTGLLYSAIM